MRRLSVLAIGLMAVSAAGLVATTAISPFAVAAPAAVPGAAAAAAAATSIASTDGPTVYVGDLTGAQLGALEATGIDREDITSQPAKAKNKISVEVVLSRAQAGKLKSQGLALSEKKVGGVVVSAKMNTEAAKGFSVFRSYSEPGGIKDELIRTAAENPDLTKLETIGKTVQGQDILALKVSKFANRIPDGAKPAVLYVAAQHAREWITPEMDRRLMHHFLDSYATDPEIKKIVDTTELWFVPVANPDGYDYTFTAGHRMWRKNLRDNDGDGVITSNDGVDPNRNFPTKWGYDNEGSSQDTASETYRGTKPESEPETRALDGLMKRMRFKYLVNYHSAAQLLSYGVGWQVSTPTPDDEIYQALVGDKAHPAVPGYDPEIAAQLYTTNGETDDFASYAYGTLAITPEMSTCQTASAVDPNDAFDPADCTSIFDFPDSEPLIEQEYEKNLPFALSVAESAQDPDDPVSSLGLSAPDFDVHAFSTSYGASQTVAVTARRSLQGLEVDYSINGGTVKNSSVKQWQGGERYGDSNDTYYAEYRGRIHGAKVGDKVEVWFTGRRASGGSSTVTARESKHFTYQVAQQAKADVLVVANEDYEGVNPTYPSSVTGPKYAQLYVDALKAEGRSAVVWDVSKQGVPDHLGVLDHFKSVIWYLGDNRLTEDPDDELTNIEGDEYPDAAVTKRQQDLTMSVRDYLNEGGRLLYTGETAGYYGVLGSLLGGIYYGLNGAPDQPCVVTQDVFSDCLLLADDFTQYYLGAYRRITLSGPAAVDGTSTPLTGLAPDFGGQGVLDNPLNEAGSFTATSDILPASQFPQFRSASSAFYRGAAGGAYDPDQGKWYVATLHSDDAYTRLARTVDLRTTTAAQKPSLNFALSYDTEPGYDNVIVEAHTVGGDDWTTLPEAGGLTDTDVPTDCEEGFLLEEHPFLAHYLTAGNPCAATGSSGSWNRMTGNSGGWKQVSFDLSAYAGKQVEVAVSYVTDSVNGGAGVYVDDTKLMIGGTATQPEGFETSLGPWGVQGPPPGSPPATQVFKRAQSLYSAAVTTKDTVMLGFGVEQLATPAERADLLGQVMKYLK